MALAVLGSTYTRLNSQRDLLAFASSPGIKGSWCHMAKNKFNLGHPLYSTAVLVGGSTERKCSLEDHTLLHSCQDSKEAAPAGRM